MFRRRLRPHMLLFVFVLRLVTGLDSVHAQPAKTVGAPTESSGVNAHDSTLARRAIAVLEQLRDDVLIYQSYEEFENGRRLARVPLETFMSKLDRARLDVESILSQMSDSKLQTHLRNALYSFRDGAFWWAWLAPQKVINAQSYGASATTTRAEDSLASTRPYTIVAHWRHAQRSLLRARALIRAETAPLR